MTTMMMTMIVDSLSYLQNMLSPTCIRPILQKIFQHNVCKNNNYTVQTVNETCP